MKIRIQHLLVRKNIKYIVGSLVLATLLLGYPCRGFIRNKVLPLSASVIYIPNLNKTTNTAANELQAVYPFGQIKYISKGAASCHLADARHLKTEVYCTKYLFRGQVPIQDASVDTFKDKATVFEHSLKAHGWSRSNDYGGVNRIYEPPYHWWYLAEYNKTTGKVRCDLTVQRDNDPKLLDAELLCYRSVLFF